MPQRPSKKPRIQPGAKPEVVQDGNATDRASRQRHEARTAKAILGKFQGRKSI